MSDILSQNEIDYLLKALNTGEQRTDVQSKPKSNVRVKGYDFKKPSKFAVDHIRMLEVIFEHLSRLVSSALPAYVRTNVHATVAAVETLSFMDFMRNLPSPVMLGVFELPPLKNNAIIQMSTNLGYAILNRLLGGKEKTQMDERAFSEIELSILYNIIDIIISRLVEPFENVISLEPELIRLETNPQFTQVISPTEVVVQATLNMNVGEVSGLISFCLPHAMLEPILEKLNTKTWYAMAKEQDNELYKDIIESSIKHTMIPVKAILGEGVISVNDFIELQEGDIIKLNRKIGDDITVQVGDFDKFKAKPGIFETRNSVQITSMLSRED